MRLDIYAQFVVSVVRPNGGWAKGRQVALIEEPGVSHEADLLIPNNLSERDLERYLADKFSAFAKAGKAIRRLDTRSPSDAARKSAYVDEVGHDQAA
jgi:hypothetical protein